MFGPAMKMRKRPAPMTTLMAALIRLFVITPAPVLPIYPSAGIRTAIASKMRSVTTVMMIVTMTVIAIPTGAAANRLLVTTTSTTGMPAANVLANTTASN